jgi:hypothetical protein
MIDNTIRCVLTTRIVPTMVATKTTHERPERGFEISELVASASQ